MEGGFSPGLERAYVNQDYVRALTLAGAVPLLLPVIEDENAIRAQMERVDGILLSGGYDIDPLQYGEEPHGQLGFIFPEVDKHQLAVARIANELQKPMFGICRGMQVINVAFGGTLYQDLSSQLSEECLLHNQKAKRYVPSHGVDITENTKLHHIFSERSIITNSFHHQAVKDIAPGFIVNARAKDGVIEGIEKTEGAFTVAVQWHPEMMAETSLEMLTLFQAFVRAVEKNIGVDS